MRPAPFRGAAALLLAAGALLAQASSGAAAARPAPRLVLLLSVDQLAAHVLAAADPYLGEDGFRRLRREGSDLLACAFAHAVTETGPGHATLATGADPAQHGIVGNAWLDPEDGKSVYCVADPSCRPVGADPETPPVGPANLLAPTLGDAMKAHLGGRCRVVSLSWKDRAAVLMAGRAADAVAWIDRRTGRFMGTNAYGAALPAWLERFNEAKPCDAFFGEVWDRIGPEAAYRGLVDDRPYERPVVPGLSRVLPRAVRGGGDAPAHAFYEELYGTPFANDLLVQAAFAAVLGESLGQDEDPDLLCVSFSANDMVGHFHGPNSVEARDITLRTDRQVAALLAGLDERVGAGRYAVILTADHGVAPIPESLADLRLAAGRAQLGKKARVAANEALVARFGAAPEGFKRWVMKEAEPFIHLDRKALAAGGVNPMEAREEAARAIASVPGVAAAFALDRILRGQLPDDPVARAVARSVHPARAGDVFYVPAPYWTEAAIPASHGTPYPYDREVPLLVMGPGIRAGHRSFTPVTPGSGVVLVAKLLGIPPPPLASAPLPDDALLP